MEWYWLGVTLGLGVAFGVLTAAVLGASRRGLVMTIAVAVAVSFAGGMLFGLDDAAVAALGALVGSASAALVVRGAVGRGGGRAATGVLVGTAGVIAAVLAFVPVVGYLELVALPALALRSRKRAVERYAGLRSLAR